MVAVEITRATMFCDGPTGLDKLSAEGGQAVAELFRLFANKDEVGTTTMLVLSLTDGMGKKTIELYRSQKRVSVILTP